MLQVSVVLESGESEGVQVARLVPVDVDAPRCTTPSASDLSVYCYKYSEIRWSHLGTHGSDHAVNGQFGPLHIITCLLKSLIFIASVIKICLVKNYYITHKLSSS